MDLGSSTTRGRCAVVWACATVVTGALILGLLPLLVETARAVGRGNLGGAGFDTVLVWCCAIAAAVATCWLWLVATLVTIDAARGLLTVRRGVPAGLRRALLALCGAALASGLAAPGLAGATAVSGPEPQPRTLAGTLAGLRLPERVSVAPAVPSGATLRPDAGQGGAVQPVAARPGRQIVQPVAQGPDVTPPPRETTVVVSPGDTLWDLAAQQLGPHSSIEETAAAWPAIYSLNREVIGPDPDVLEPGQRLVLPPAGPDEDAR
jgi:hypothetical protein